MKPINPLLILICLTVTALLSCNSSPQSLVGSWIDVMPETAQFKQGFTLNNDGSAKSINMATLVYDSWQIYDNTLILNGQSLGNGQNITFSDTLSISKITQDSLILKSSYGYIMKYTKEANK